jgi:putative FmdB family regulatory protein
VPVYEYRCSGGHHYEKTEGFDAPREHECPTCAAPAARQISLPAVIFKGSGFYSTDNRKSGGGNGRSSDGAPVSTSNDGHGHSHEGGAGHSHDSDSASTTKAAASD